MCGFVRRLDSEEESVHVRVAAFRRIQFVKMALHCEKGLLVLRSPLRNRYPGQQLCGSFQPVVFVCSPTKLQSAETNEWAVKRAEQWGRQLNMFFFMLFSWFWSSWPNQDLILLGDDTAGGVGMTGGAAWSQSRSNEQTHSINDDGRGA